MCTVTRDGWPRHAVCLHGRPQLPGMFTLAVIDGSHVDAQSNDIGNSGMSCNHGAQSSDYFLRTVVRHFNSSSRASMLCLAIHGSRTCALFSVALAAQIFGRQERTTVVTISVRCFTIVVFVLMGVRVMRLFPGNNDGDDSTEKNTPLTGSQHDTEQGGKLMRVDAVMDVIRTRLGIGYNIST